MIKFKLIENHAPGDTLMMTSLVRDIERTYPGKYAIDVETPYPSIWLFNPFLTRTTPQVSKEFTPLRLDYGKFMPNRVTFNDGAHFIGAFHRSFKDMTGITVPLTEPRGDLHFSSDELPPPETPPRYWLLLAGGKTDFITKHWSYTGYQTVADTLKGFGIPVVQVGAARNGIDHHVPLKGVQNLVGQTTLRQLIQLIAKADGVICTITFAMHAAAALGRPCVVIAGGREEDWWEAYHRNNSRLGENAHLLPVNHRFLHTIGQVVCHPDLSARGCWRSAVIPADWVSPSDEKHNANTNCIRPTEMAGQILPECMIRITPERVVESVLSYYYDGTLLPIIGTPMTHLPSADSPIIVEMPNRQRAVLRLEYLPPETGSCSPSLSLPQVFSPKTDEPIGIPDSPT